MTPYLQMALNNAWANSTLYAALAGLSEAEFAAPRPGFFPSISETLNHILIVDLYYLDALEEGGLGRRIREQPPETTPAGLGARQAEADMRLATFCGNLTEAQLTRRVRTERDEDPEMTERVDRLLLHLFQHQIHHRGQAHVQVQDAGIAPPQLDDFYLDHDRAPSARPYWTE
ncbi:DinB family protein [Pseudooceanicola sp.]|uniref:DinB family protein n=1 Tax=Pseudooceanicola sp. TaxID=1914328 RepID=UPI0035C68BFB